MGEFDLYENCPQNPSGRLIFNFFECRTCDFNDCPRKSYLQKESP